MQNNVIEKSGLVSFLETKNISEETALSIAPSFEDFYNQATEWKSKATNFLQDLTISQEEKAKESRTARLALVKVRTGIDKKRKDLNEDDNRRIKERNKVASELTELVSPIEDLLLEEEKKQENEQKAINEAIRNERAEKLNAYGVDSTFYDLINMPEEMFEALLENSRIAVDAKLELEKRTEEERLKVERYNLRIARLMLMGFYFHEHSYNHEFGLEVSLNVINEFPEENFMNMVISIEKAIFEEKQLRENTAKIEAERLAKENAVLQAQKDELERKEKEKEENHNNAITRQTQLSTYNFSASYDECLVMTDDVFNMILVERKSYYEAEQNRLFIEKRKAEFEAAKIEKEAKEKAEKERANELAPDKDKINNYIASIQLPSLSEINLKSKESQDLYNLIDTKFQGFKKWANEQINTIK